MAEDNSTDDREEADTTAKTSFQQIGKWYWRPIIDDPDWDEDYEMYKVEVIDLTLQNDGRRKVKVKINNTATEKDVVLDDPAQAWSDFPTTVRKVGDFGYLLINKAHGQAQPVITSLAEARKWPDAGEVFVLLRLLGIQPVSNPEELLPILRSRLGALAGDTKKLYRLINRLRTR